MSEFKKVEQNKSLYSAILVDIDWTIAEKWNRSHFEWKKVWEDIPHMDIINLVKVLSIHYEIIFVSGRSDICFNETFEWLRRYFDFWIELYMRKDWDFRKDDLVKYEILNELIKENYIEFCIDDRDQVVKMYRESGIRVLQVAEWNF